MAGDKNLPPGGKWITMGQGGMNGHKVYINKRGQILAGGVPDWVIGSFLCPHGIDPDKGEETVDQRVRSHGFDKQGKKKIKPHDTRGYHADFSLADVKQLLQEEEAKHARGDWLNITHKFGNTKNLFGALNQSKPGLIVRVAGSHTPGLNGQWKKQQNGQWVHKQHRGYIHLAHLTSDPTATVYTKESGLEKIFHSMQPTTKSFDVGFWRRVG